MILLPKSLYFKGHNWDEKLEEQIYKSDELLLILSVPKINEEQMCND